MAAAKLIEAHRNGADDLPRRKHLQSEDPRTTRTTLVAERTITARRDRGVRLQQRRRLFLVEDHKEERAHVQDHRPNRHLQCGDRRFYRKGSLVEGDRS